MPVTRIDVPQFLQLAATLPVFDVRSEGEYAQAHFPGAHSLPLFSNEERSVIGTAYKQESQQKAIKLGLKFFGPKMVQMVEAVEQRLQHLPSKAVIVYCWRGGMRSGGVAWMLDLYGFEVYTIIGGYKAFRNWGIRQLALPVPLKLVGGYTGSGKTEVLAELKRLGQPVIDLEGLACHKGSAFGNIGMPAQPSQEMFENLLALELWRLSEAGAPIWLEDESQRIGTVNIPTPFYQHMLTQPVYFLDIPFEARLRHIVAGYGKADRERLVGAILRIQKRLGGLETKNAVNHIIEGDIAGGFAILLRYYDKWYSKSLQLKTGGAGQVHTIACALVHAIANTQQLLNFQIAPTHV